MFWIVQTEFDNDYSVRDLKENLIKMGVEHTLVDVRPFSELDPDYDKDFVHIPEDKKNNCFVYGSITLSKIGQRLGWKPGSFTSPDFNYLTMNHIWGKDCLNHGCHYTDFVEALSLFRQWGYTDTFFVRPHFDNKSFNGQIIEPDDFETWATNIVELSQNDEFTTLNCDTPIILSKLKHIEKEFRFVVVDGKIVTVSQYKVGNRVIHSRDIDSNVQWFADAVLQTTLYPNIKKLPKAFVLDVCLSEGEPKILEFGSINNAGFYGCDTQKIIDAIERL